MLIPYNPQQSPIDLGLANPVACIFPPAYLSLQWAGPLEGVPEGEPDELKFVFKKLKPTTGLRLGGKFFRLLQFHFHAPSEHKVRKKGWPLEVHMVHQDPKSKLYAVLGVLVEAGRGRPAASHFFGELTKCCSDSDESTVPVSVDPNDLLPANRGDFYRYEGSLTTKTQEDNEETVSWVIFREPLHVDRATLRKFIKLGHKAKVVQKPHRRFVLTSFVSSL